MENEIYFCYGCTKYYKFVNTKKIINNKYECKEVEVPFKESYLNNDDIIELKCANCECE